MLPTSTAVTRSIKLSNIWCSQKSGGWSPYKQMSVMGNLMAHNIHQLSALNFPCAAEPKPGETVFTQDGNCIMVASSRSALMIEQPRMECLTFFMLSASWASALGLDSGWHLGGVRWLIVEVKLLEDVSSRIDIRSMVEVERRMDPCEIMHGNRKHL